MDSSRKERVLAELEALCSEANYVAFQRMQSVTGLTVEQLIELKPDLERRIQLRSPKLSLTSRVDLDPPGFFIEE
jgi:ribosomal protein L10